MSKRSIHFASTAWDDYTYWQKSDKKIINKINRLIGEIQRTPFEGIGKPEPLKENYAGLWSRRIDGEHRFIYTAKADEVQLVSCRYHYQS